MSKIAKIIRTQLSEDKKTLKVVAVMEDGDEEYTAYIGGDVELFTTRAVTGFFVKKNKD
jgi:hypothetical protein